MVNTYMMRPGSNFWSSQYLLLEPFCLFEFCPKFTPATVYAIYMYADAYKGGKSDNNELD